MLCFVFILICYYLINMASLKTVKKWEEILKCELGKEIEGNKVTKIKCKVCIKHEQNIIRMKGFSKSWIKGTTSVKKDSLEKHVEGDPHLHAVDLEKKTKTWGRYLQSRGGFFFANREGISKNG